jgi:Pvc16 N-terminal domain/Carboxypeptidase regulatory-like domain
VSLTTQISLNTSLADLDGALHRLLRREIAGIDGFPELRVAFNMPDRAWAAALSQPTVNLFLYDVRENRGRRQAQWGPDDSRALERPPLWLDAAYAVTAFAREAEDEHRLLSQALTVLWSYPELPDDVLDDATLSSARTQFGSLRGRLADPSEDATPEFWAALGGTYKVSFNYVITLPFPSGRVLHRGPPPHVIGIEPPTRAAQRAAWRPLVDEARLAGGRVVDDDGRPVSGAWVAVMELGRISTTDDDGRFSLRNIRAGSHPVAVRTDDGRSGTGTLDVPGPKLTVTVRPEPSP